MKKSVKASSDQEPLPPHAQPMEKQGQPMEKQAAPAPEKPLGQFLSDFMQNSKADPSVKDRLAREFKALFKAKQEAMRKKGELERQHQQTIMKKQSQWYSLFADFMKNRKQRGVVIPDKIGQQFQANLKRGDYTKDGGVMQMLLRESVKASKEATRFREEKKTIQAAVEAAVTNRLTQMNNQHAAWFKTLGSTPPGRLGQQSRAEMTTKVTYKASKQEKPQVVSEAFKVNNAFAEFDRVVGGRDVGNADFVVTGKNRFHKRRRLH